MNDVGVAATFERLPWLADEPLPRALPSRQKRFSPLWPLWAASALVALIVIAGGAYWLGTRSGAVDEPRSAITEPNRPPVTVTLPAPVALPPQPEVRFDPVPQVEPVVVPPPPPVARAQVPSPAKKISRRAPRPAARARAAAAPRAAPTRTVRSRAAAAKPDEALPVWPVRVEAHNAGRLVRVGTFATRSDAKRGWTKIMRFYPGMRRLPAMAVPISAVPSGRRYFRLQMGTTSQAHSEVLCQRMRIIGVSCVVLDIGPTRR